MNWEQKMIVLKLKNTGKKHCHDENVAIYKKLCKMSHFHLITSHGYELNLSHLSWILSFKILSLENNH